MSVWLLNDTWWKTARGHWLMLVLAVIIAASVTVLTWIFVAWQFRKRLCAALLEAACINVAARIVSGEIADDDDRPTPHRTCPVGPCSQPDRQHLLLPRPIANEMDQDGFGKALRQEVQIPECVTFIAIGLWAFLLLLRVLIPIR